MTREHKIALIVGFALVLLVGLAVSDHLSQARFARLEPALTQQDERVASGSPTSPIPRSAPIDSFAGAPVRATGPIQKSLNKSQHPVTEMLSRLRDRVEDMPIAAATSKARTTDNQTNKPTSSRSTSTAADQKSIAFTWHSIKEGETLWSIAQAAYGDGMLAGKLAQFNGSRAANPDLIRIGVRLRLPPKYVLTGGKAPTIHQGPVKKKVVQTANRMYTIKPGDTLGEIAQRELGTIKRMGEILALNKTTIRQPDSLPVGATIRLPAR